jgi:hypothetical protein
MQSPYKKDPCTEIKVFIETTVGKDQTYWISYTYIWYIFLAINTPRLHAYDMLRSWLTLQYQPLCTAWPFVPRKSPHVCTVLCESILGKLEFKTSSSLQSSWNLNLSNVEGLEGHYAYMPHYRLFTCLFNTHGRLNFLTSSRHCTAKAMTLLQHLLI